MITVAKIKIWGTLVGAVIWDNNKGFATFEYDSAFVKSGLDLAPLLMPIAKPRNAREVFSFPFLNKETYKGLPGLLADSLPDRYGNQLIEAWLAQQGRNPDSLNPVERLCYIGKRGMGALEFEPLLSAEENTSTSIEINQLVEVARNVLNQKIDLNTNIKRQPQKGLMDIIRVGTSAGGARAKAIIAFNEKTGDVRSGQVDDLKDYDYWIIKFDGVTNKALGDPKGYGRIEYAYYLMAKKAGIAMSYSILLKEHGRAHFMTKRFDRNGNEKVHMQTLCAIAHLDYNSPNIYAYEQAFECARKLNLSYPEMAELYRRMVFNVVARNQDDHTKNMAFLMNRQGAWSLSPAYDVTYAFDPANKWMKSHQMSINGKFDNITQKDMLILAKKMNIKKPGKIIQEVVSAVKHWNSFAKKAGVSLKQTEAIKKTFSFK